MSNVLIGIIGVILFIGLALAGASFVGPLVTEGNSQKNAATILNSLSQTAASARIYRMRTGNYAPASLTAVDTLVASGALSRRPQNPLVPAYHPVILNASGTLTGSPAYVVMSMGQSEQARNACIEIEIQSNRNDRLNPSVMEQPVAFTSRASLSSPGCHRNSTTNGGASGAANDYLAFFPL